MIVTKGLGGALLTKGFNNGAMWREVLRIASRINCTLALRSYIHRSP